MSLNGDEYSFPTSYLHQGYLISLGCYNRLNGSLNITLHLPLDNEWHYKTENRWRHIYIHNVLDYKIYVNYDFIFANTIIFSFNEYFTTLSSLTFYVHYMERKTNENKETKCCDQRGTGLLQKEKNALFLNWSYPCTDRGLDYTSLLIRSV